MPDWKEHIRARLDPMSFAGARGSEIVEEIAQGLEARYEEALAAGSGEEEAVRIALAELGEGDRLSRTLRRALTPPFPGQLGGALREATRSIPLGRERGASLLHGLGQDLAFGARMLLKHPFLTLTVVAILAFGIGANTAIFSVVDALILDPFPFPRSDRIVLVEARHISGRNSGAGYRDFLDWGSQNSVFEEMAILGWNTAYTLTGAGEPQRLTGARTTQGFLRVLGVQPHQGRFFTAEEDRQGAPKVVVLHYETWQRLFGGRADILGRPLTLDGESCVVIGIMPRRFVFPGQRSCDFWEPLQENPDHDRRQHQYGVVARLRPEASVEQARAEMSTIASRLEQEFPATNTGWRVAVMPLAQSLARDARQPVAALFLTVLFVLLLACANVAGLLLARTAGRSREVALRAALGASRGRIARQMLTESLMLAALGGALGLLFALWLMDILRIATPPDLGLDLALRLNPLVLAYTAAASLLTGIGFGLAPAWYSAKTDLNTILKGGGNAWSGFRSRNRLLSVLVVGEVALSLLLLVAAGLLIRDFRWILRLDTGIRSERVLTFEVRLPAGRYGRAQGIAFHQDLLASLRAMPGVEAAGAVYTLPMTGLYSGGGFEIEGRPKPADWIEMSAQYNAATPDYFRSMGIPLILGRDFDARDTASAPLVVIIDRTLARQFFPDQNPLGHRIRLGGWRTIVGIVGSVNHQQPMRPPRPQIYSPYAQSGGGMMWITLRAAGDPGGLMAASRHAVRSLEPDALVEKLRPMEHVVAESLGPQRLIMAFLSGFAGFALVLAVIGLYGVIAYSVGQRTQEIGVRMTLGATRAGILRLVAGRGAVLACIGIAIGMPCALAAARLLGSLLYGISPYDGLVFLAVPLVLLAAAMAAAFIPARRAASLDPLVALRRE